MRFFKPIISFFLFILILSLSAGVAHAKNDKGKMKYQGMDRNNDGVVTREEWRGNRRSFGNHDWNGDGVLSGDEARPGARQRSAGPDRFGELDHNHNGVISRGEWHNTRRSFEGLDFNRDGLLNQDEFYNRQQYPVSVFWELDQNNDGHISRNEWRGTNDAFNRLDTNRSNRLSENEFNGRRSLSLVEQIFQDIFRGR